MKADQWDDALYADDPPPLSLWLIVFAAWLAVALISAALILGTWWLA